MKIITLRLMLRVLVVIFLLSNALSVFSQPNELFIDAQNHPLSAEQSRILQRLQQQDFAFELRIVQTNEGLLSSADRIVINLFDGQGHIVKADRVKTSDNSSFVWSGSVENVPSHILLSVYKDAVVGRIQINDQVYSLRYLGDGLCAIARVDPKQYPPCGNVAGQTRADDASDFRASLPKGDSIESFESSANMAGTIPVKLFVAFTPAAQTAAGGPDGMTALIQAAIEAANQTYANSNILSLQLELAHQYEVNYAESRTYGGTFLDQCDQEIQRLTDLERFHDTDDGYMDEIHDLRGAYGADMTVLIVDRDNFGPSGQAYHFGLGAAEAFCWVHYEFAADNWTLAHEIGHLFGARHEKLRDPCDLPSPIGHGYQLPNTQIGTIMAVALDLTRIPHWSNPDVIYQGQPTGTDACCNVAELLARRAGTVEDFVTEISGPIISSQTISGIALLNNITVDNSATLTFAPNSQVFIKEGSTSLEVKSGSKLIVQPGAKIKFAAPGTGSNIVVRAGAQLEAIGTASAPILFSTAEANPGPKSWRHVWLYGSNNQLEHCTFEYGNIFYIYGYPSASSGNTVKNCTFRYFDHGLHVQQSTVTIENTTLENNRHAFVFHNSADVTIDGATVQHNGRDGIYTSGSVVDVFNSAFEYNGEGDVSTIHGIYAYSGSDVALGSRSFNTDPEAVAGYNTICQNHGAGVLVAGSAMVLAGDYQGPPEIYYMAGSNSLDGNGTLSGTYSGKDFYNNTGSAMYARYNYWGNVPPPCPPVANQITGTVLTDPCLDVPPGISPIAFRERGNFANKGNTALVADASGDLDKEVKQQLIAEYKATISSNPDSPEAVAALRAYYSLVRTDRQDKLSERSVAADYLQGLASAHADLPLGHTALQLLILETQRTGDLTGAIALSQQALTKLPKHEQAGVLFNLVWMTLSAGQVEQARTLAADFKARFPELESEAMHLEETLAEMAPDLAAFAASRAAAGETVQPENTNTDAGFQARATEFGLTNYPNPFNPETRIRYELPTSAQVQLTIYNLTGQQVRSFQPGQQAAGVHTVVWDGRDSAKTVWRQAL